MLRYGYISNGFADHSLEQMVQVLNHFGYDGVGITLDHIHLDPFEVGTRKLDSVRRMLEEAELEPVVETGARFYLDPFRKHRPSLLSVDREARRWRVRYYRRAIEIAAALGSKLVSLWSGTPQKSLSTDRCWSMLESSLGEVLDYAQEHGIVIGFEPEPGMFINGLTEFRELQQRIDHPALQMTMDLGHLAVTEDPPYENYIHEFKDVLVNVHIDDIRERQHVHLPLGAGEIDFPPLLKALQEIEYDRLGLVELSRNSADAPVQAQRSLIFLRDAE